MWRRVDRTGHRIVGLVVVAALVVAKSVAAQVPVHAFAGLAGSLKSDDRVEVVDRKGEILYGTVTEVSDADVTLRVHGSKMTFREAEVASIVRLAGPGSTATLVGAGAGYGWSLTMPHRPKPHFFTDLLSMAAGGGIGSVVSLVLGHEDVVYTRASIAELAGALRPGDEIEVVDSQGRSTTGKVESITLAGITLNGADQRTFRPSDVRTVTHVWGVHAGPAVGIGAALGVALPFLFLRGNGGDEDIAPFAALLFGPLGAGLGGVVYAIDHKELVMYTATQTTRRATVSVVPEVLGGRRAVLVALRF